MNIAAMRIERSTSAVANAVELTAQIVRRTAGNEVANTLHGETVTFEALSRLVVARIHKNLQAQKSAV